MAERIPQSTSYLVVFRAYLASDGKTPATGKTIAITISKNGATSFSNPNAGATNATEMASGFYQFTLDTTDTGTLGPLAWRGAQADINDAGDVLTVAKATNAGFSALPDAAAEASGGLPTLSAAQASNGTINANVHRWLTGTPNALQSGRVDGYLGAAASGVLAAASFASGAFDAVWAVATRELTGFSASFKTGYALSSAGVQAIWDALTSALTTVGSIGKLLVDNINATISSRLPTSSYTTPPTVGAIADQVWEETLSDHSGTAGSTAAALNAAGSAGDPWATALPGSYTSGQAGKILGDNLNATVGSRATQTSVDDLPTNAELAASQAAADDATLAAIAGLTIPTAAQNAAAVLSAAQSNPIHANAKEVNDVVLDGTGVLGDEWRPA